VSTYILIHGIGNQDSNFEWFRSAISELQEDVRINFVPFYWEDMREPAAEKFLQEVRGFPTLNTLSAMSGLLDLITYRKSERACFIRLHHLISRYPDAVLVAHSLGSVLAYRYITSEYYTQGSLSKLITLGSPIGRRPVSTRVKPHRLNIPWVNVTGTLDFVTSWLGSGKIKEADTNILLDNTHDLTSYLKKTEYLYQGNQNVCKT
jgi:pimeloyl-ACP methyl ester carboxylesterase